MQHLSVAVKDPQNYSMELEEEEEKEHWDIKNK